MTEQGKRVNIKINTTEEFLKSIDKTIEEIQNEIIFLTQHVGDKYFQMLLGLRKSETNFIFDTPLIRRALYLASIFREIYQLEGYKRHLKAYSKQSVEDHIFTAKVARWLTELGYKVEMEPETPPDMKDPDIKCVKEGEQPVYIECKRIRTDKFFDLEEKQDLANLIYEKLPTCDQLNFYLYHENSADKVKQHVPDKSFASTIYHAGMNFEESTIEVEGEFHVCVIQKSPIIGHEDDFLNVIIQGWLQDVNSGVRLPGYTFMRGGRSIAIHGPPPSYSRIWNKKRSKSKKQSIENHPFVTIMLDEDVLGDPKEHQRFFDEVWLTADNAEFSGIGFLSFAEHINEPEKLRFTFSFNPHAKNPLPKTFFTEIED